MLIRFEGAAENSEATYPGHAGRGLSLPQECFADAQVGAEPGEGQRCSAHPRRIETHALPPCLVSIQFSNRLGLDVRVQTGLAYVNQAPRTSERLFQAWGLIF